MTGRRVPPLFKAEIVRAYGRDRDATVAKIAGDFGVHKGYPTRAAKEAGAPLRRPRARRVEEGSHE